MIRSAMIKNVGLILITCILMLSPASTSAATMVIKLATLAPEGSSWIKTFNSIDKEVQEKTGKQVQFKFYPGGVLGGDEKDMLRKMHIGQIHSAALSSAGLSAIFNEMDVFQIPFLFESHDEVDYVIKEMDVFFQEGFEKNDYVLLAWSEAGFVHLMSTRPVATLDDLRKFKVWTWADSPMTKVIFDEANVSAIPLSAPDVLVGLQTGLVDVVYAPPSLAIALQWFTKTPYVSTVPLTDGIGGLIVSKRFYDGLPADLQALLSETGQATGEKLIAATRVDNQKSLLTLKERGLEFVEPGEGMSEAVLLDLRDRAAAELVKSDYIPASVFDKTRQLLEQYRSGQTDAALPRE